MADPIVTLPTAFQQYIHLSKYARWVEAENRRETWAETVKRYLDFFCDKQCKGKVSTMIRNELEAAMLNLEVMPSMRALMTAGPALERDNIAGYNCSAVAIDHPCVFDEILYILMCGTGVGFSVERQFINELPSVPVKLEPVGETIVVSDSKVGWAEAYRHLIKRLYEGKIPKWDVSKVRPAGTRLKTFGGRASGPGPLEDLFRFTINIFQGASVDGGRKLNSIECHDICCKVGEAVVSGGVRRCLPGNTMVFTPKGPKAIKDIVKGDTVITGGQCGTVVSCGTSGIKETIIIKHRFGEIKCTPEHRLAVFNSIMEYEFKMAKDIVEGDRLVWDIVGYDGTYTELPALSQDIHFNSNMPNIPLLDADIAWFLGLFHGDGYVGESSLEIAGNLREISTLERAAKIFESKFGIRATVGNDGKCGAGARMRANSVVMSRWFSRYIKQPNTPIRVPDFIFQAKRNIRFAYLAGLLDADGRVRKEGGIDQACTIYESFAEDIVTLLASLGIAAIITKSSAEKRRVRGENAKDFYNIHIVGNTNRKMFYDGCKNMSFRLAKKVLTYSSSIDFSFPIRWGGSNLGYKSTGNILVMKMRYNLPLLPTRVITIKQGQTVETYDIQVDKLERFTANGLVVHNSALVSLSNPSDDRMRYAKSGDWWKTNKQRELANNSIAYTEKPSMEVFMREWLALFESKSGERGIFNRDAAVRHMQKFGRRNFNHPFGINPCGEVLLRLSGGLCNLTEVVIRPDDDIDSLRHKVKLATILGTMQATLTEFRYLRPIWKKNAEEEALLGVSLTGIFDNTLTNGKLGYDRLADALDHLRLYTREVNATWSNKLNINRSAATSTTKPSGTVSLLCDCSSGIHPRFARYYVRRIRGDKRDPLSQMMVASGFPCEDDTSQPENRYVFSFPMESPAHATFSEQITALDHLKLWLIYRQHWTEHNVSATIYLREHEWLAAGAWVYEHFNEIGGITFLPFTGHTYHQAPLEELTKEKYQELCAKMPKKVDWSKLKEFEKEDSTSTQKELACTGDACELPQP